MCVRYFIYVYIYLCYSVSLSKQINGVYGEGVHLFPFRTEQLSPSAPMVLQSNVGE